MKKIHLTITTASNCLIGNQTQSFTVGGVDQATVTDPEGYPMIPGSAMKGVCRTMVRDQEADCPRIKAFYEQYFRRLLQEYKSMLSEETNSSIQRQTLQNMMDQINTCAKQIKPEYIFGIAGLNHTPGLYFSDLKAVREEGISVKDYFRIDTKTSITEENNGNVVSNPRTYQVVKSGVSFRGVIHLRGFEAEEQTMQGIIEELKRVLELFNEEYYFIGNSKSRGYGKIKIVFE